MFGCRNKRLKSEGPVWHVYIDESGTPYYVRPSDRTWKRNGKVGKDPFVLGGIMTDDPEELAKISLEQPRRTKMGKKHQRSPGHGELKHSESNDRVIKSVIRSIDGSNAVPFMVVVEKLDPETEDVLDKFELYARSIGDLAQLVADLGLSGEYRFIIDSSAYYNQEWFEEQIRRTFSNITGLTLSDDFVQKMDSRNSPQIQTADMLVGERKEREERGSGDLFDEMHGIRTRRRDNRRE